MKTFVIGDIHGAYKALLQCFERSHFDYNNDRLIALGDVCDRKPQTKECIDELLKIKHLDYILGNHDFWTLKWAEEGFQESIWLTQGGFETIASYKNQPMPLSHIHFLKNAHWWLEIDGNLFIHGGFDPQISLSEQDKETFIWDRDLIHSAIALNAQNPQCQISTYKEIFIGHNNVQFLGITKPLHVCNLWDMDTGAGWTGKLTMMDINTKEYWQSDLVTLLY
ncbi:MAG: fructose-bisphosphatase class III [Candidatus Omnitrophica bacterium]|nr:fructose-bisphosphatase class III [Candidatus Omnitrophota bacterium]